MALTCAFSSNVRAATFTVTTTADSGPGSLRQAILDANATPGVGGIVRDVIHFAISGDGPITIAPATLLPQVTDPVIIDGFTQPGSAENTNPVGSGVNPVLRIELSGAGIVPTNSSVGLSLSGGSITIRGLVINRFRTAILCNGGAGYVIAGNYIGTDPAGQTAPFTHGSDSREHVGVALQGASGSLVGGRTPASRNLLSGAFLANVLIAGPGAVDNAVEGNIIGTNASGTAAIQVLGGNGGRGVVIENGASMNVIGGSDPAARNLLSGGGSGVNLSHPQYANPPSVPPTRNIIQGNLIGLEVTGTAALTLSNAISTFGVILGGNENVVGGTEAGERNIISGNSSGGIAIGYDPAVGNRVEGNFIGLNEAGTKAVPNGRYGIEVRSGANGTVIGGTAAGAGNRITGGVFSGIGVHRAIPTESSRNAFLGNSIFNNGGLGIDLGIDGVTANDAGDADGGPNGWQNFPVLTSASYSAGTVRIAGYLHSRPNTTYRLEFFGNEMVDPSVFGEGQTFLHFASVSTDGAGNAPLDITFAAAQKITATASDPDGNTSEFSAPPPGLLQNISTRGRVETGDNVLIGGFIITGEAAKKVIIRGIGPSLVAGGVATALPDPTLELIHGNGEPIVSNDNWRENEAEVQATGIPPGHDAESAIVRTLTPGAYTAVLTGSNGSTGVALVEIYDLTPESGAELANISTRGVVGRAEDVMIAGLQPGGGGGGFTRVMLRAIGPSLPVQGNLADPTLELLDASGTAVAANDNWRQSQEAEIQATGIPPANDREAAIVATLRPAAYTAVVRGAAETIGVALVEVYALD